MLRLKCSQNGPYCHWFHADREVSGTAPKTIFIFQYSHEGTPLLIQWQRMFRIFSLYCMQFYTASFCFDHFLKAKHLNEQIVYGFTCLLYADLSTRSIDPLFLVCDCAIVNMLFSMSWQLYRTQRWAKAKHVCKFLIYWICPYLLFREFCCWQVCQQVISCPAKRYFSTLKLETVNMSE